MDYAKGIAIFGVVIWHVVGGVVGSGVTHTPAMEAFGDLWDMYTFRLMPVFFFLSGMFFVRSVDRPFMKVFISKLRTVAYPYFVWSIITLLVGTLTLSVRNGGESISDLPRLLYDPILHYWFLYALFVIMIGYYLLAQLKINRWIIAVGSVALFIASAATIFYTQWYVGGQIGYFAAYFVAGAVIGPKFAALVENTPIRTHLVLIVLSIVAFVLMPITALNVESLIWQPMASTLALIVTISISAVLSKWEVLGFIDYWGQLSLEIYLVHVLALASFRIVLFNILNIDNAWIHIIGGVIFAMAVPIILVWVLNKLNMNILFVAPRLSQQRKVKQPIAEATQ